MFAQQKSMKLLFCSALLSAMLLPAVAAAQTVSSNGGNRAEIVLNVPRNALVWVDGVRTRSGGLMRRFVTPPLTPGRKYSYDLRVTWIDGGRAREINRHVSFRGGERLLFNFAPSYRMQPTRDLYFDPAAPAPWRTDYNADPLNAPSYPNFLFPGSVWRPR